MTLTEVLRRLSLALVNARGEGERRRAEQALVGSEARYRRLVDTIPQGIDEIDLDGSFLLVNPARARMLGYEEAELTAKTIWDVLEDDETCAAVRAYLQMLAKEQPEPTPWIGSNTRRNGELIDVEINWDYRRDEQGHVTGFISVITDVTERLTAGRRLQESEARFRRVFEEGPLAISIVDPSLRFVAANAKMCRMVGYSSEELSTLTFPEITHPD